MIVFRNPLTTEQLNSVSAIAQKCGISQKLAEILLSRGVDTPEKAFEFLHPGKANFNDPFKLAGMREAVERITAAKEYGESIVVFGDYDADGICASTVLTNALRDFGLQNVFTVIPERTDGYGLTHDLVEKMLEDYQPDLVITVDCGISCKEEVSFIEDVGVDVIVTDHHELPEELPDCTVINCKIKQQEYPCDVLCGAGVAYKLAYALIGERANKYLDLVAVATIADSMPLLGENRDIVYEGLELIKNHPYAALSAIIEKSGLKEITSTGIAFTVAPRINAAGRMGNAKCALNLMLEEQPELISLGCDKLNEYNAKRQVECDLLFKSAKAKLAQGGLHKKCIVLADKGWNGGLVGIVAAKLVEEYNRPVILFTEKDGNYHGSARSIEGINIFQAINECKDCLMGFGGHAQAAGLTVSKENLPLFEQAFARVIEQNYDASYFVSKTQADELLTQKFEESFAEELNLLEPYGTGNRKPVFCVCAENVNAYPIKVGSPHISFKTEYISLIYFNGEKNLDLVNSPAEKYITFEANLSYFNGKSSLKGYVKNVEYKTLDNERLALDCFKNDLLSVFNGKEIDEIADNQSIAELFNNLEDENILFAASRVRTVKRLGIKVDACRLYRPDKNQSGHSVVLSLKDFDCSDFTRVVYLDKPFGNCALCNNINRYTVAENCAYDYSKLSVSREVFAEVFKLVKYNHFYGKSSVDIAMGIEHATLNKQQLVFCVEVFLELKIFTFIAGSLQIDKNVKSDLSKSLIYNRVCEYIKSVLG